VSDGARSGAPSAPRTIPIALTRATLILFVITSACGGQHGRPPDRPPIVKDAEGREYHLLDRGAYKAYYDRWGRLQRIEYDENGDGRADHIAHHDGARLPHLIEIDEDHDGQVDRWERYGPDGVLQKVGTTSRPGGLPDVWTILGPGGEPKQREIDADGDGKPERTEILEGGVVVAVELDLDGDGRVDRWQRWSGGRLVQEEIDSDGDGRPDVRLQHQGAGAMGAERLKR
jgi:hypothetical protein